MSAPVPTEPKIPTCNAPFGWVIAPKSAISFSYILNVPTVLYSSMNLSFSTPSFDVIPFPIPGITGGYYKIEENKAFDPNGILSVGGKGITTNLPQVLKYKKVRKRKFGIKYWIWVPYIPKQIVKIFPFQIVKTKEKLISNPIKIPSFSFNFNVLMSITNLTTSIDFYFDGAVAELVRAMINLFQLPPSFINESMGVSGVLQKVLTTINISRVLYTLTGGNSNLAITPIYMTISIKDIKFEFNFTFVNFKLQFGNAILDFSDLGFTTGPIDVLKLLKPVAGIDINSLSFGIGINKGVLTPLNIKLFFEIAPSMLIPGLPINPTLYDFIVKIIEQNINSESSKLAYLTQIINTINNFKLDKWLKVVGLSYSTFISYCPTIPPPGNLFVCISIYLNFKGIFTAIINLLRSDEMKQTVNSVKYALMNIPSNVPMPNTLKTLINEWNNRYSLINNLCQQQNNIILNTMADSLEYVIENGKITDFQTIFTLCAPLVV